MDKFYGIPYYGKIFKKSKKKPEKSYFGQMYLRNI